ncbi:MAG: hypothetical protein IH969_00315, partial [Candidatus Krumholzibacteriota bacterium]|nr:hypothetical protein [Candidatus Krumholzibacteriota bacterium]
MIVKKADDVAREVVGAGEGTERQVLIGPDEGPNFAMRRFIMQMKPKQLEHVIAMVALFRPGPMDFIPSYIRRMHGEEDLEFLHPSLEPIFRETYGIPVYQEQLMRAAV